MQTDAPEPRRPLHPLQGGRRTVTAVVAGVILVLGLLGGAVSGLGLATVLLMPADVLDDQSLELLTGGLAITAQIVDLFSKIGLITIGVLLMLRSRFALPVTYATFAVSVLGTILSAIFQARLMSQSEHMTVAPFQWIGFGCTSLLAISIYIGLIFFLTRPATRAEWAGVDGTAPGAEQVF